MEYPIIEKDVLKYCLARYGASLGSSNGFPTSGVIPPDVGPNSSGVPPTVNAKSRAPPERRPAPPSRRQQQSDASIPNRDFSASVDNRWKSDSLSSTPGHAMAGDAQQAVRLKGMVLFGIGMSEERVRRIYRSAEGLGSVGDRPKAMAWSGGRQACFMSLEPQKHMRLWSLHPRYLDPQGLVALWREALLARAVLREQTRGYRNHPQLERFRSQAAPLSAISAYLSGIHAEAVSRGYCFDCSKIGRVRTQVAVFVTTGQVGFEWQHLMRKLSARNPILYRRWSKCIAPDCHPLFRVRAGPVEPWERSHNGA
jgi:hypothetical protein